MSPVVNAPDRAVSAHLSFLKALLPIRSSLSNIAISSVGIMFKAQKLPSIDNIISVNIDLSSVEPTCAGSEKAVSQVSG